MDISNQILLVAQKPKELGGIHTISKVRYFNLKYLCIVCGFSFSYVKKNFDLTFMETWLCR